MNLQRYAFPFSFVAASLAASLTVGAAPQTRSVADGVYTEAQAARGQTLYEAQCASCHGPALQGRTGPPLVGDDFQATWGALPVADLANKIRRTMPRNAAKLTPAETADVVAYLLQAGKFPASGGELPAEEGVLAQIRFPQPAGGAAKLPAVATQMPALPAAGNVAQVMRGILFPAANIVFTVQTIDPATPRPPVKDDSPGGFDWAAWGNGIYPAWDVVDYAAVSVAESAALMLTPGRRCENGRIVPVSDPDWIRFTMELADAGKTAYKASQTRDQATVSESTNQLNASCQNCHRVYRGRTHCVKP